MIRIEIDTVIRRPITEIFERLININGYSEWLPESKVFVNCRQTSEGPVGPGTTLIDRTRIGTYQGEVTAFNRPTKVGFRMRLRWLGVNVMESRPKYQLRTMNDNTEVHMYAEGELYGLFKLAEPYIARVAQFERTRTIEALKKSLESSPH